MSYRDNAQPAGVCLRCGTALAWVTAVDEHFTRCDTCGSVQVRRDTFERMRARMAPFAEGHRLEAASGKGRPCPVCQAPMSGARVDRVILDVCALHGIWCDPRELEGALAAQALEAEPWLALFGKRIEELG